MSSSEGTPPPVSFERDIRPLFRDADVEVMSFAFDLADHRDVQDHAVDVYERLADGSMPCDQRWPAEQLELFRRWIEAGTPP